MGLETGVRYLEDDLGLLEAALGQGVALGAAEALALSRWSHEGVNARG